MRAIKLSLAAFGPYLEKQVIDFEELGDESIFLITGPTGAGKTTVFDAICYALYGRASGSDREQDSLRSHFAHTGDKTEVTFQFALNNREYLVIRTPKQQRKKEKGEGYTDEPAKAALYQKINDEMRLQTSRIKEVDEMIESLLGFDYEQFRKMVLIPQGEFRKLISENSKEREAILQKIFHTHFYEKMTEELHTESKTLKDEITQSEMRIHQEISKIDWKYHEIDDEDLLSDLVRKIAEEIKKTEKLVKQEKEKQKEKHQAVQRAQTNLNNGKIVEEKFAEKEKLLNNKENLKASSGRIEEQKRRFQRAKEADRLMPLETQSQARKKEWEDLQRQHREQKEKTENIQARFKTIEENYQQVKNQEPEREHLKETIKAENAILEQVNSYLTLKKESSDVAEKAKKENMQLKTTEETLKDKNNKLEAIEKELEQEQALIREYYDTKESMKQKKEEKEKLEALQKENQYLAKLREQYQSAHVVYKQKETKLERLRRDFEIEEQKQKENAAAYMAHHLAQGGACPVCGSTHHPNKAGTPQATVDYKETENLKIQMEQAEKDFDVQKNKLLEQTSKGQSQKQIVDRLYKEIKAILPDLEEATFRRVNNEWKEAISKYESEWNKQKKKLEELKALRAEKDKEKREHEKVKQTFDQLTDNLTETRNEAIKLETRLEEMAKNLPETTSDFRTFEDQLRKKEQQHETMIKRFESIQKDYQTTYDSLQKEKTILEQTNEFEAKTKENYEHQHQEFTSAIQSSSFETVEAYMQAKLSANEQAEIEDEIKQFEENVKQIDLRLKDLQKQLEDKERPNLEKLEEIAQIKQSELQAANDYIYTLHTKITNNEQVQTQVHAEWEKQKETEKQYYMIGELAELANGNNQLKLSFERYVLASFLDEILIQANLRLDRMTDHRYQLIRSGQVAKRGAQSGLDLEVLDHYTGTQRSVKTLSGGEGFKASLSLALGMADVVQTHAGGVQMDTLFIDEGFGTLDEISLQQAIDCLKDLQDSNRLLGIISHVPALKQEIHAKLQVSPSQNGSQMKFVFH